MDRIGPIVVNLSLAPQDQSSRHTADITLWKRAIIDENDATMRDAMFSPFLDQRGNCAHISCDTGSCLPTGLGKNQGVVSLQESSFLPRLQADDVYGRIERQTGL